MEQEPRAYSRAYVYNIVQMKSQIVGIQCTHVIRSKYRVLKRETKKKVKNKTDFNGHLCTVHLRALTTVAICPLCMAAYPFLQVTHTQIDHYVIWKDIIHIIVDEYVCVCEWCLYVFMCVWLYECAG